MQKIEQIRNKWDRYFFKNTLLAAEMSTCLRRSVGAILVKDKRIIATGFNGQVSGTEHCKTCYRLENNVPSGQMSEKCFAVHAEQNIIAQCASQGISSQNTTLYCTHKPCFTCAKILFNSGVIEINYLEDYPDELTDHLFNETGTLYATWDKFFNFLKNKKR
jgi:dCMP deaminase